MHQSKITKEEINNLPIVSFEKEIIIIDKEEQVEEAISILKEAKIIGFDTETRPAFKKKQSYKVALLQLATLDTCYLFRLNKIGIPYLLVELLQSEDVIKVGLSLKDDFLSLGKRTEMHLKGFIDLQKIVKYYQIEELSLQKIYALLFNQKISKSQRLSNWESEVLTEQQKKYAALDAYACLQIYNRLIEIKKER